MNNIYPVSQEIVEKDQEIEDLKRLLELKEQIIVGLREDIKNAKKKNEIIEFGEDVLEDVIKSKKERENYLSG